MSATLSLCLLVIITLISNGEASPTYEEFYSAAKDDFSFLKETYEHLHTIPEMKFEEHMTSQYIQEQLKANGIKFTTNWGYNAHNQTNPKQGGTGIVAEVGTGKGPCVGMRADFDALPIQELVDVPYKSTHDGVMHACGHDSHATMLLGSAKLIKKFEDQIDGTIKFFFQPGEEGGAGAYMMVQEGVMDVEPKPQGMFAFHVASMYPTGAIGSCPGPITAAATNFFIKVTGMGGHAAGHFMTVDPIAITTDIAQGINTMVARETYFQKDKAAVVSITNLYTGNTASFNVIPKEMWMSGTMRALTHETMNKMKKRIAEIAHETATAAHAEAEVTFPEFYYGPTYNDPDFFDFFEKTMSPATSFDKVIVTEANMGGEDFSYFAEKVPSVLAFLGTGSGKVGPNDHPTDYPAHSAKFAMDEDALPIGAAMYAYFGSQALQYFDSEKSQNSSYDEL